MGSIKELERRAAELETEYAAHVAEFAIFESFILKTIAIILDADDRDALREAVEEQIRLFRLAGDHERTNAAQQLLSAIKANFPLGDS